MGSLAAQINAMVQAEIGDLVKRISIDYKLDLDEMNKKYNIVFTTPKETGTSTEEDQSAAKKPVRGRKKKAKEEYLQTTEYIYNGITYLVDGKNNVYTYSLESPTLIGEKLVDGTIKFSKKE